MRRLTAAVEVEGIRVEGSAQGSRAATCSQFDPEQLGLVSMETAPITPVAALQALCPTQWLTIQETIWKEKTEPSGSGEALTYGTENSCYLIWEVQ